jgi:hypothetical protein
VAKPPPYIDTMTQQAPTNSSLLPAPADDGMLAYRMPPSTKNTV